MEMDGNGKMWYLDVLGCSSAWFCKNLVAKGFFFREIDFVSEVLKLSKCPFNAELSWSHKTSK